MDLSPMIEKINEAAQTVNPVTPADYKGEDGLIYCGNCHTPKQVICDFGGVLGKRVVSAMCECVRKRKEAEQEEQRRIALTERIKDLRRNAFNSSFEQTKFTFENDDGCMPKITNAMKNYVANFAEFYEKGEGLLLYGGCGSGKTYAACEVANALIDKGHAVSVTNIARIVSAYYANAAETKAWYDESCRLMVIDDLGAERETSYAKERVYNVVDTCYRNGTPMIITTNMGIEEFKNPKDVSSARIYDRVLEKCFPIEIAGKNHRRAKIIKNFNEMKEKLDL